MAASKQDRIDEILEASAELRENLGEAFPMLIDELLADAPVKLEEIQAAVHAQDPVELHAKAHALKGSVTIFGLPDVVSACLQLEDAGRSGDLANAGALIGYLREELPVIYAALEQIRDQF